MSLRRFAPLLLLLPLFACDGGSQSPSTPPTPPTPPGNQPAANPCVAALAQSAPAAVSGPAAELTGKGRFGFGADERDVTDLLWRSALGARAGHRAAPVPEAISQDVGQIAVLEDDSTLLLPKNPLDLQNVGLRFERNSGGGYDVTAADAAFRTPLGSRVSLTDDDSTSQAIGFTFPYYGGTFSSLFVNSDGNLTFDEADAASTERGFARLLGGAPRIAPFFADLDPSAGGGVFVQSSADALTVTWCNVRGFDRTEAVTAQAVLLPSGVVEMKYATPTLTEAIVGLSPGRNGTLTAVDLSTGGRRAGGTSAVGERFSSVAELDTVQAAKRFYATHPDTFDQLVFWTDTTVVNDAFAFESTVSNGIRGLGSQIFNQSADFGSGGTLESVMVMDRVAKYGDDPNAKILGENTALAVVAHETGHRWLTQMRFRDGSAAGSDALLGRQRAHWSFFFDSDASVMEGNDIEDRGGGNFRTVDAAQRYSKLDLYGMGLIPAGDVPPFFYVDAPANVQGERNRESAPRIGVTFNGTRRDLGIQDVIDAIGERQPNADASPRLHRQAWVYVITRGTSPSPADLARLARLRTAFEPFFARITENRMTLTTTLR
jgi:hypothetical protein